MGISAKVVFHQHTTHPEMTNKHYTSISNVRENARHAGLARRESLETDTTNAAMVA